MEDDIQPLGVGLIQYVNGLRVIFEEKPCEIKWKEYI